VITCTKIRDNDGKLTKTHIPLSNLGNKKLVIIDDICDGGATFLNIAKTIKEHYVGVDEPKIYLIVTHGIFSKGFNELNKYFDGIYCTNSYNNLTDKNGTSCPESEKVKQKNVF
jgi:ribose-phosphate pyrophosphokinase